MLAGVRRDEDALRLAADPSGQVEPIRLDVTSPEDVAAVAEAVERLPGPLAGLVNNAGIAVAGPVELLSVEDWRRHFEVNVLGAVAVTKAMLPALRHAHGRVVNVSSVSGLVAGALFGPYSASKFALEAFTDTLRREMAPFGVRVAAVEPGPVATPIWAKSLAASEAGVADADPDVLARYDRMVDRVRAGAEHSSRHGVPPEQVAAVIASALTDRRPRSRYMVGRDPERPDELGPPAARPDDGHAGQQGPGLSHEPSPARSGSRSGGSPTDLAWLHC